MRIMVRHYLLHGALGFMLAILAATGPAQAETREIAGETLVLNLSMSSDTVISTDPSLSGHVRVSMDGTLSCLSVTGTESAAVVTTSGCSDDNGTLRIDVPPAMPLNVTGNGIGGRAAHLVLSVRGSSDVSFTDVQGGGAMLEMTGSGDVRLASVSGMLILKHHGSGDLAVGHIDAAVMQVESTGSGDMLVGAGNIGTLSVRMQGDGDLAVAATVANADISAHGGGDVKLGVVTGTLHRSSGEGSDIIVGGPAVVNTVIGKVAHAIGTGHQEMSYSSNGFGHFLTLLVIALGVFIAWRMVRRGRLRAAAPAGVIHPGVVAVTDTLRRVEERLGRVEGYVTSREFDLQQKFRKL
jgi:hypothetical protein